MNRYSILCAWSDDDRAFVAISVEFPGLSGLGRTRFRAIRELRTAIRLVCTILDDEHTPRPHPLSIYDLIARLTPPKESS